jgi:hypothetical protein
LTSWEVRTTDKKGTDEVILNKRKPICHESRAADFTYIGEKLSNYQVATSMVIKAVRQGVATDYTALRSGLAQPT